MLSSQITKKREVLYMNGMFRAMMKSTDDAEALEKLMPLRKVESFPERIQKAFMEELRGEKGHGSPGPLVTKNKNLALKAEKNKPFTRLRSLKQSHDSEKLSVMMLKDSHDAGIRGYDRDKESGDRSF